MPQETFCSSVLSKIALYFITAKLLRINIYFRTIFTMVFVFSHYFFQFLVLRKCSNFVSWIAFAGVWGWQAELQDSIPGTGDDLKQRYWCSHLVYFIGQLENNWLLRQIAFLIPYQGFWTTTPVFVNTYLPHNHVKKTKSNSKL